MFHKQNSALGRAAFKCDIRGKRKETGSSASPSCSPDQHLCFDCYPKIFPTRAAFLYQYYEAAMYIQGESVGFSINIVTFMVFHLPQD